MLDRLINLQSLYAFLEPESYIVIAVLALTSWIAYKIFLQNVSAERHRNLRQHFKTLFKFFSFLSVFFASFIFAKGSQISVFDVLTPYLALLTYVTGLVVIIKGSRLLVLEYLFMGSMQSGVPLLLVNIFSLVLSLVLVFWSVSRVFGVQLAPLLATSAIFSIILGLAMQDTLGNLFAGISLQFDRNFEIGDWVEVLNGTQKAVGQVKEISWRSTLLLGLSDELITLPNRIVAQAQISNFSPPDQPIARSQMFRLPHLAPLELCKEILEQTAAQVAEVRGLPAPIALVSENNESWYGIKLSYFIDSYGSQFVIGDKILRAGTENLEKAGIKLAHSRLEILNPSHGESTN